MTQNTATDITARIDIVPNEQYDLEVEAILEDFRKELEIEDFEKFYPVSR